MWHLITLVPKILKRTMPLFTINTLLNISSIPYSVTLASSDWLASGHIAVLGVSVLLSSA